MTNEISHKDSQVKRVFAIVVLAIAAIPVIASMVNRSNTQASPAVTAEAAGPPAPTCVTDWKVCADNADLANHYGRMFHIQRACQDSANEQARYGEPKWPNDHWFLPPFGRFNKGNDYAKSGVVELFEPSVQFQNGFGAYVRTSATCTYNLRTESVANVNIFQP